MSYGVVGKNPNHLESCDSGQWADAACADRERDLFLLFFGGEKTPKGMFKTLSTQTCVHTKPPASAHVFTRGSN